MKKFRQLSEQHREKGRFKPTIPHNVKSHTVATPRMKEEVEQIDELSKTTLASYATKAADQARNKKDAAIGHVRKFKGLTSSGEIEKSNKADRRIEGVKGAIKRLAKEEVDTPPIHVRSMYTRQYAKHGGTISTAKTASAKAYDAVEKMHGKEMRDKLEAFHRHNMNESVEQLEEGRPSQRHPLEGHEYHKKTDAELVHIAKDAHKAAEAMKGHNTQAENKYRDQANDSATVRYFRQKSGMPNWYKKKYGHVKEEVEQIDEMDKSQPSSDRGGESSGNPWEKGGKATPITAKKTKTNFLSILNKSIDKVYKAKQDTATKMVKHKMKEETEQLDELSKEKLNKYVTKAIKQHPASSEHNPENKKTTQRISGLRRATSRLYKEEQIDEVSDTTLSSYTQKAKTSADKLESEKKFGKALKRRVGVLSAVSKMTGRAGQKIGQLAKEETEQLDELSPATKASYKEKAKKTIAELRPHAKSGEYKDIAKNIIARREKGLEKVKEESEISEGENKQIKGGDPCWKGYEMVGKKMKGGREVPNCVPVKEGTWHTVKHTTGPTKVYVPSKDEEKPPFEGGTKAKEKAIPGKYGKGYSTARHLARMAMQKQMKKAPIKEESRKAAIVKEVLKKKKETSDDKFEVDPIMSKSVTRNY